MVRLPTSFRGGFSRIFRAHMFLPLRRHFFRNIVRRVKQPLRDIIPWQATWNMPATTKAGCANLKLPGLRKPPRLCRDAPLPIFGGCFTRAKKTSPLKIIESRAGDWRMSLDHQSIKCWSSAPIGWWLNLRICRQNLTETTNQTFFPTTNNVHWFLVSTTISVGYPLLISHRYWKLACHSWVNHHLYIYIYIIHFHGPYYIHPSIP